VDGVPAEYEDLLASKFATFATIDDAGFPQLTEVWFLAEDGEVKISLNKTRRKTSNLVARPECSLFILDLGNPFRYLELRGRARVADDDGSFAARVGAKYDADLATWDRPGDTRVVVTIDPVKIHPVDMSH
jgi:PPOX class probable F420-dependent enzyme